MSLFHGIETAYAMPDFRASQTINGIRIFQDHVRSNTYYYAPVSVAIAREDDNPEVRLFITRYTGTAARDDRGENFIRSFFQFRVKLIAPTSDELDAIVETLRGGSRRRIRLKPLSLKRIESGLIYTPLIDGEADEDTASTAVLGEMEAGTDEAYGRYWQERDITVSLDEETAELFWRELPKGALLMSFGYAFFADGISPDEPLSELTGTPELLEKIQEALPEPAEEAQTSLQMVNADVLPIRVDDPENWNDFFTRLDLNAEAPPGYPVLRVYCFDFYDNLSDLFFERWLEIRAQSVGGQTTFQRIVFTDRNREIYNFSVRFPYAVRFDLPYEYRIVSITADGDEIVTPWTESNSWVSSIDITSSPQERAVLAGEDLAVDETVDEGAEGSEL